MKTKTELRKEVKELKKALSTEHKAQFSRVICERVYEELSELSEPTVISLYLSMPDEVKTDHLIHLLKEDNKHTIVIPRVETDTIIRFYELKNPEQYGSSDYGILEPEGELTELIPTVMIVPGVAFDRKGGRVGRGRGYYDRYFAKHKAEIKRKIAIAYELQVFDEVPMDKYDYSMDQLITEKE